MYKQIIAGNWVKERERESNLCFLKEINLKISSVYECVCVSIPSNNCVLY